MKDLTQLTDIAIFGDNTSDTTAGATA